MEEATCGANVYYRAERSAPDLHGWTVILVDDGLATGSSMLAAVRYVNSFRPSEGDSGRSGRHGRSVFTSEDLH